MIQSSALGFAIAEADHEVSEIGGNNQGPRMIDYRLNSDPPIHQDVPWCALFIQYCSDTVCKAMQVPNPLDDVKLEAYVQSYHNWGDVHGLVVPWRSSQPGDLALFNFRNTRWDHIGFVLTAPGANGLFTTIEGNTSNESERDGDGVFIKTRVCTGAYPVSFIRWFE